MDTDEGAEPLSLCQAMGQVVLPVLDHTPLLSLCSSRPGCVTGTRLDSGIAPEFCSVSMSILYLRASPPLAVVPEWARVQGFFSPLLKKRASFCQCLWNIVEVFFSFFTAVVT